MDDGSDPDLEIGDEDQADGDEMGQFGQDPEDEQQGFGGGDGADEEGDEFGGDDQEGGDGQFGDEGGDEEGQFGDEEDGDGQDGQFGGEEGDEEGQPEEDDEDDPFDSSYESDPREFAPGDDDEEGDEQPEEDDEDDPDLDVSDDDEAEEEAPPKKKKSFGEDFGFGIDQAQDDIFIAEKFDYFKDQMSKLKSKGLDPDTYKKKASALSGGMKKFNHISTLLGAIKSQRDAMLKTLRKHHKHIQGSDIHPDAKSEQLTQLSGMAHENRKHFQKQAQKLKAMMVAKKEAGGGEEAPQQKEKPQQQQRSAEKPQQQPQKMGMKKAKMKPSGGMRPQFA